MIYNALYNDKRRACALISGPYADRAAATAELASDRAWVEAHVVGGHFAAAFGRWFAVELAALDGAGAPWRTARDVLETGRGAQALARAIKDHEDSGGALLWVRIERRDV